MSSINNSNCKKPVFLLAAAVQDTCDRRLDRRPNTTSVLNRRHYQSKDSATVEARRRRFRKTAAIEMDIEAERRNE